MLCELDVDARLSDFVWLVADEELEPSRELVFAELVVRRRVLEVFEMLEDELENEDKLLVVMFAVVLDETALAWVVAVEFTPEVESEVVEEVIDFEVACVDDKVLVEVDVFRLLVLDIWGVVLGPVCEGVDVFWELVLDIWEVMLGPVCKGVDDEVVVGPTVDPVCWETKVTVTAGGQEVA